VQRPPVRHHPPHRHPALHHPAQRAHQREHLVQEAEVPEPPPVRPQTVVAAHPLAAPAVPAPQEA
jgi:hypothetical protein